MRGLASADTSCTLPLTEPFPRGRGPSREARGFDGIQALRALAACAVAFLHLADEAGALTGTPGQAPWRWVDAVPLEAGVDLFFVISGFVMTWASWDSFGRAGAVPLFAARRLLRIVPLYWLLTLATVVVAAAAPGAISDGLRDGPGYVVASFAFFPWRRADGFVQPVLRLGWTLEYEMLFYALMAGALMLRRPAGLATILLALGGLVAAGQAAPFTSTPLVFWTDPVIAEFALGVLVAIAARRGWRGGWSALLACLAVAALASQAPDAAPRAMVRGLPAALLVFSALSWRAVPGWLLLVGNASYALYLVHPFPMRALRVVAFHLALPPGGYLAAASASCLVAAIALHLLVEQPILRWGRLRLSGG